MSSGTEAYVPWSQRPGWEDLEPVAQNDAPKCLVPIAYHEQCQSLSPPAPRSNGATEHISRDDRSGCDGHVPSPDQEGREEQAHARAD